jgi:hypothetical protein
MLSAKEFLMREPLPLHEVHEAIFEFCRNREDVAIFGAQAVNLYVSHPRMTQDVDLLSSALTTTAEDLAANLGQRFHIAVRVRIIKEGRACRVYQVRGEGPRHLADVRISDFPLSQITVEQDGLRYVSLPILVAMKVSAFTKRAHAPKGASDLADLRRLLLAHPELRNDTSVPEWIEKMNGDAQVLSTWCRLLEEPLTEDDEDAY